MESEDCVDEPDFLETTSREHKNSAIEDDIIKQGLESPFDHPFLKKSNRTPNKSPMHRKESTPSASNIDIRSYTKYSNRFSDRFGESLRFESRKGSVSESNMHLSIDSD